MTHMTPFTKTQRDELLALLDIRRETVEDDPDSADELEAIPGALDTLEEKIKIGAMQYTELEKNWIIEEARCRISVCDANAANEGAAVNGLRNSMQNVIDKLEAWPTLASNS